MDASEIHAERLNAQEVSTPKKKVNIYIYTNIFSIADGKVKQSGGDQVLRTSTLILDSTERGEEREDLKKKIRRVSTTRLIAG